MGRLRISSTHISRTTPWKRCLVSSSRNQEERNREATRPTAVGYCYSYWNKRAPHSATHATRVHGDTGCSMHALRLTVQYNIDKAVRATREHRAREQHISFTASRHPQQHFAVNGCSLHCSDHLRVCPRAMYRVSAP